MFSIADIPASHIPALWSLALATVSFSAYWLLFVSGRLQRKCSAAWPGDAGKVKHLLGLKYAGFLMLGVLPVAIFLLANPSLGPADIGLGMSAGILKDTAGWVMMLAPVALIFCWFTSRRNKTFAAYPQIRIREWNSRLILQYGVAWSIYMLGYEMLFRGLMLFPLVEAYGVWSAIAIHTMLYAVSHVPKGTDETFASMFFGPLMCYITLETGSIWAVWIIHSCLAVGNSLTALYFHPEFTIVRSRAVGRAAPQVLE